MTVRFKLNMRGLNRIMKSEKMQEHLKMVGDEVAKNASMIAGNEPFEAEVHKADYTAIATVYPATYGAAEANLETNVLLKAVGAAGLPQTKPTLDGSNMTTLVIKHHNYTRVIYCRSSDMERGVLNCHV